MALFPSSKRVVRIDMAAQRVLAELVEVISFLHQQGWTPATSSNFSCRSDDQEGSFYVSASGKDKGYLTVQDFLAVDMAGKALGEGSKKPSAETLLHCLIYRHFPQARAVLHTHSVNSTVLSKLDEQSGCLTLQGFEILKAFEGIKTHETTVQVPIFSNSQDMAALSKEIEGWLQQHKQPVYGFLLAGHGLYTWGDSPAQAKRHVEAFEFLMECVLKLRSYGYADRSR